MKIYIWHPRLFGLKIPLINLKILDLSGIVCPQHIRHSFCQILSFFASFKIQGDSTTKQDNGVLRIGKAFLLNLGIVN